MLLLKRDVDMKDPSKPVVRGVSVLQAGKRHNFGHRLIEQGVSEGWLSLASGQITIQSKPPVVYRVLKVPGYYCCHDGARMTDGAAARAYIAAKFAGKPSPDRNNPSGYAKLNHYECELVK